MPQSDLPYRLALARVPRIGAKRMAQMESHFGSMADAWSAPDGELRQAGIDGATLRSLHQARGRTDPDSEMAKLQASGVQVYTLHDDAYPPRLREIYDAPRCCSSAGRSCRPTNGRWRWWGRAGCRRTGGR